MDLYTWLISHVVFMTDGGISDFGKVKPNSCFTLVGSMYRALHSGHNALTSNMMQAKDVMLNELQ